MKTIPVTIISIVALALSGCATGYYQRGYVGYNSGYSAPSHYRSYERSYYGPGTSFSYGREYVRPSYGYQHREHEQHRDRLHDWNSYAPRSEHRGGWNDRRDGGMHRESVPRHQHTEQSRHGGNDAGPHYRQQVPERHEHGFGGGHDGGRRHHDRHAD